MPLPGFQSPAAGFEEPFELLLACHERVQRTLQLLTRLQHHLATNQWDAAARDAAVDVMRYFDLAAPLHHQDEEIHVFPQVLASCNEGTRGIVQKLQEDHVQMHAKWLLARTVLEYVVAGSPDSWTPLGTAQICALQEFSGLYAQHIEAEEQIIYPQARQNFPEAALSRMRQDMMERRGVPLSVLTATATLT